MKTVAHASHVPLSLRLMRLEENLETIDRRERGSRDIFYCVASRTNRAFLLFFSSLPLSFSFLYFFFFKERSIRLSADNGLRNVTGVSGDVSSLRACFLSSCAPIAERLRRFLRSFAFTEVIESSGKMDRVCLDPLALFSITGMMSRMDLLFSRLVHEFVFETALILLWDCLDLMKHLRKSGMFM